MEGINIEALLPVAKSIHRHCNYLGGCKRKGGVTVAREEAVVGGGRCRQGGESQNTYVLPAAMNLLRAICLRLLTPVCGNDLGEPRRARAGDESRCLKAASFPAYARPPSAAANAALG